MKRIELNKKQKEEMKRIVKFFMECVEPISDIDERSIVAAKISSHLACLSHRLTGHFGEAQKPILEEQLQMHIDMYKKDEREAAKTCQYEKAMVARERAIALQNFVVSLKHNGVLK